MLMKSKGQFIDLPLHMHIVDKINPNIKWHKKCLSQNKTKDNMPEESGREF